MNGKVFQVKEASNNSDNTVNIVDVILLIDVILYGNR